LLNQNYRDILSALLKESADFLLVGAHALAAHGVPRATGDMDIYIRGTKSNAEKVWRALADFGAPLSGLNIDDLESPDLVFQVGVAPSRIDILTFIDGVEFEEAWTNKVVQDIEGFPVPIISREDLLRNKKASGRPRDLADIASLEEVSPD